MNDQPIPSMQHYGQKPDSLTSGFNFGFQGQFKNHPPDNRRRKLPVYLRDLLGRQLQIGTIYFGGDCCQSGAEMDGIQAAIEAGWIPDDPRVIRFLEQYPVKLPNLGALQLQREYPLQLPYLGGVAVIPGDVEIV